MPSLLLTRSHTSYTFLSCQLSSMVFKYCSDIRPTSCFLNYLTLLYFSFLFAIDTEEFKGCGSLLLLFFLSITRYFVSPFILFFFNLRNFLKTCKCYSCKPLSFRPFHTYNFKQHPQEEMVKIKPKKMSGIFFLISV